MSDKKYIPLANKDVIKDYVLNVLGEPDFPYRIKIVMTWVVGDVERYRVDIQRKRIDIFHDEAGYLPHSYFIKVKVTNDTTEVVFCDPPIEACYAVTNTSCNQKEKTNV